jgi:hypothetical protein
VNPFDWQQRKRIPYPYSLSQPEVHVARTRDDDNGDEEPDDRPRRKDEKMMKTMSALAGEVEMRKRMKMKNARSVPVVEDAAALTIPPRKTSVLSIRCSATRTWSFLSYSDVVATVLHCRSSACARRRMKKHDPIR